jgi:hypothetical protein
VKKGIKKDNPYARQMMGMNNGGSMIGMDLSGMEALVGAHPGATININST